PGNDRVLRRRLLARLIDRNMPATGERRHAIADDQRVELDKAMALLLVDVGDFRARGQFIAAARGAEQLHLAADVNPRTEDGVVDQYLVHHPLQQAGMTEPFANIDPIAL